MDMLSHFGQLSWVVHATLICHGEYSFVGCCKVPVRINRGNHVHILRALARHMHSCF